MPRRKDVPTKPVSRRPPTINRRTKVQIASDEGFFCDNTHLRVNALKHGWELLQTTVFKTGSVTLRTAEGQTLTPDQTRLLSATAAAWGMEAGFAIVNAMCQISLQQRLTE